MLARVPPVVPYAYNRANERKGTHMHLRTAPTTLGTCALCDHCRADHRTGGPCRVALCRCLGFLAPASGDK